MCTWGVKCTPCFLLSPEWLKTKEKRKKNDVNRSDLLSFKYVDHHLPFVMYVYRWMKVWDSFRHVIKTTDVTRRTSNLYLYWKKKVSRWWWGHLYVVRTVVCRLHLHHHAFYIWVIRVPLCSFFHPSVAHYVGDHHSPLFLSLSLSLFYSLVLFNVEKK